MDRLRDFELQRGIIAYSIVNPPNRIKEKLAQAKFDLYQQIDHLLRITRTPAQDNQLKELRLKWTLIQQRQ